MTRASIFTSGLLGLASILWLYPHPSLAQPLLWRIAQTPFGSVKNNTSATYEDDRIKVVVRECGRKQEVLTCQAVLTSKNNDRPLKLNGNSIKLVDFEGNDYNPIGFRLANKASENNAIETELVENVPFKASFNFGKLPTNFDRIALLQIPISLNGNPATLKFRNLTIASSGGVPIAIEAAKSSGNKTSSPSDTSTNNNSASICPDNTKILYRAASKSYLLYVCGSNNPTHLIGRTKDGTPEFNLRLRHHERTKFIADNDNTSYTIAADRLIVRKDNKTIAQEKIQVLQALSAPSSSKETPKTTLKKTDKSPGANSARDRRQSERSATTTKH